MRHARTTKHSVSCETRLLCSRLACESQSSSIIHESHCARVRRFSRAPIIVCLRRRAGGWQGMLVAGGRADAGAGRREGCLALRVAWRRATSAGPSSGSGSSTAVAAPGAAADSCKPSSSRSPRRTACATRVHILSRHILYETAPTGLFFTGQVCHWFVQSCRIDAYEK